MAQTRASSRGVAKPEVAKKETKKTDAAETKKAEAVETAVKETAKAAAAPLEVGDAIPSITLLDQLSTPVDLSKLTDKRVIVLFSYPKASTPGCTRQACGYRDNFPKLDPKAYVFGISADSPKAQLSFQTKHGFQYPLLLDPQRELLGVLGAKKTPAKGVTRLHWVFVDGKLKHKHVGISPEQLVKLGLEEVEAESVA